MEGIKKSAQIFEEYLSLNKMREQRKGGKKRKRKTKIQNNASPNPQIKRVHDGKYMVDEVTHLNLRLI